jgi:hypothetical protein
MHPRLVVSAIVLLAAAVSGCYRWTRPAPPAPSTLGARTGQVRVTLTDGGQVLLYRARVQGDSLLGDTSLVWGDLAPRAAIPLADIRALSIRQFSVGRTTLVAVSIPVAVVGMALLGWALGWAPSSSW